MYRQQAEMLEQVPCSEYSAALQLSLLHIDLGLIQDPILDIGCGLNCTLVRHLNAMGFEAMGIDRFSDTSPNCRKADWLEYNYGHKKWGTIVSHLGFTNHFKHHHLRIDGNYLEYAKKYMQILEALKTGGRFYYSPELPFIEEYLDRNRFEIIHYNTNDAGIQTTVILRKM